MDPALPKLLLTDAERVRFACWCELEAKTQDEMARQMERLKVPKELISKYRAEAMAAQVIAKKLRSIESMTLTR